MQFNVKGSALECCFRNGLGYDQSFLLSLVPCGKASKQGYTGVYKKGKEIMFLKDKSSVVCMRKKGF